MHVYHEREEGLTSNLRLGFLETRIFDGISDPAVFFDEETYGDDLAVIHQRKEMVGVFGNGNDVMRLRVPR